jgi:hypothetical protein
LENTWERQPSEGTWWASKWCKMHRFNDIISLLITTHLKNLKRVPKKMGLMAHSQKELSNPYLKIITWLLRLATSG